MKTIRIFIVDDHPIVNRGLIALLDKPENNLKVVGCAFNGRDAIEKICSKNVDVVLMDVRLPEIDGIEATRILKKKDKNIKIIILTTFNDRDCIAKAVRAEADGFLLKDAPEELIENSIRSVFNGKFLISSEAAKILAENQLNKDKNLSSKGSKNKLDMLSQREQEVFFLLINGKDNNEIANELYISEHTVRNYVSNIYSILGLKNRTAAILWAQKNISI